MTFRKLDLLIEILLEIIFKNNTEIILKMPGIITHFKILKESIRFLSKRSKKTFLLRSIESLLNNEEHFKAALFGSLGPNIFDYMPY